MKWQLSCSLFVGAAVAAAAVAACGVEKMYVKRSHKDDQDSSASVYSYYVQSGAPSLSYSMHEGSHLGHTLGPVRHYHPVQFPAAPHTRISPLATVELRSTPSASSEEKKREDYLSGFVKEGGNEYGSSSRSRSGDKGETGYETAEEYAKGSKRAYADEDSQERYTKSGGNKSVQQQAGGHVAADFAAAEAARGGLSSEKKGHRKGAKTTGYRRVHHKDEYKKKHSFYDESDRRGHFNKYGDYQASKAGSSGGKVAGGGVDRAHDSAEFGKKGFEEKGRYIDQDSRYKGGRGKEAHYMDFDEYSKKGGRESAREDGFIDNGSSKGYY